MYSLAQCTKLDLMIVATVLDILSNYTFRVANYAFKIELSVMLLNSCYNQPYFGSINFSLC